MQASSSCRNTHARNLLLVGRSTGTSTSTCTYIITLGPKWLFVQYNSSALITPLFLKSTKLNNREVLLLVPCSHPISWTQITKFFFPFYLPSVLRIETRASHLWDKCSITFWAALNSRSTCLHLQRSWVYKHEPPCLMFFNLSSVIDTHWCIRDVHIGILIPVNILPFFTKGIFHMWLR
jgi:hypothetical protein